MFLLPWSVSLSQLSLLGFWSMIDFIIELGVGFIYVWYIGALEWN
jgi:NADH-quinone oxidoreductase subunit A